MLLLLTAACRKLSREDYEVLPNRIVLLRHAESAGNVDSSTYCTVSCACSPGVSIQQRMQRICAVCACGGSWLAWSAQ